MAQSQDSFDGYKLHYKQFDQLLAEVKLDFKNYNIEHYIQPETLLKVARRCNFELGLKINKWSEKILEVEHNRTRLPDNFLKLNYATICGDHEIEFLNAQGSYVTEEPVPVRDIVPQYTPFNDFKDNCHIDRTDGHNTYEDLIPHRVYTQPCGEKKHLIQVIGSTRRTYKVFRPLRMRSSPELHLFSPNRRRDEDFENGIAFDGFYEFREHRIDEGWIKDGFIHTTLRCGHLYINYETSMEDDDGNLIVLSHPLIDEYYETALKYQILEGMFFEGEDVSQKLNYMKEIAQVAKTKALSVKRTPNFTEMREAWSLNRISFQRRYTNMFLP